MRRSFRLAVLAIFMLAAEPASAEDTICASLKEFVKAPFDGKEQPTGRRWLEFHWRGSWLGEEGWGFGCRQSPDTNSEKLCAWFSHNSSYEFATRLPQRILRCYGYRFPAGAFWGNWKSNIPIWTRDNRQLLLEVDLSGDLPGETGAIRLSAFADEENDATVELPEMLAMPPLVVTEDAQ